MTAAAPDWRVILEYGGWLCLGGGVLLSVLVWTFPRVFLKRFPAEVQAAVAPLSRREKLIGWIAGVPFLVMLVLFPTLASLQVDASQGGEAGFAALFTTAYGVWMVFNLFDWLVLDIALIGWLRPKSLRLKGAEHVGLRFDHRKHAADFVRGSVMGAVLAGVIAAVIAAL